MTEDEYKAARATMPWTEHSYQTPKGQVILQLIDNRGQEVPLFTMLAFVTMMTRMISTNKPAKENDSARPAKTD